MGGLSPIQFILSNNGNKIINLDNNFKDTWFSTIGNYYINATEEFIEESNSNISNINFINGNIYETIKKIESNSMDCVIDSCSLHTLMGSNLYSSNNNENIYFLMHQIERILKKNGYFISVGDVANPNLGSCSNLFKYPNDMKNILQTDNLKLIEPFDYDTWETELCDYDNFVKGKNIDYKDLSLINMKYDKWVGDDARQYLWVSSYILKKN